MGRKNAASDSFIRKIDFQFGQTIDFSRMEAIDE
jgi:hypothetical protein